MKVTMKLLRLTLAALLLLPLSVLAQRGPESPVVKEMDGINRNIRTLNRQIADPAQKDSSLQLVDGIQKHIDAALKLTPPQVEKLEGDAKTKMLGTYQNDLNALTREVAALKQAVTDGKTDVARAELDKITKLRDSSHKELGVKMGGGRRRGPGGPPPEAGGPPPGSPPAE